MEMISTGTCPESAIPAVGHTQRATINQNRHEIHVMTVSHILFMALISLWKFQTSEEYSNIPNFLLPIC